ncbi:metallophosphoesterase family protein [Leptolyngbya sp. AN03gr2]|uniref:metallophosphoesterase family protein n=1 Tax=Leptolyngbya sp. AN03gr2 TaxID=3423364 RepID=UPI003D313D8E
MTEFFIADMHFGSASNAKWRKFSSSNAMDAAIIEAWQERVGEDDIVWVLGDVGSLEPLRDLAGTKHLIFGNDDKPKGKFKESGVFASLSNSHTHESGRGSILMIHRPQDAPLDTTPVLHGHTHSMPDEPDPRFVSVSVDKTGWGPISLDEVWRRIDQRRQHTK